MKAAVVTSFENPPHYLDFESPIARPGEVLVKVKAAALSQLARGRAAGRHYSSGGALPFVAGVDAVGRLEDGRRVYFAFPRPPYGAMATEAAASEAACVPVPDDLDDVRAAAIANPGMSSWAALTERARFRAGESVLINGATGASGRLAIRIAKHLGARRVVATGRSATSVEPLRALGADATIALDQTPDALTRALRAELGNGVDVVLDYLWGPSAERLIDAIGGRGAPEPTVRVRFVQIGALSGPTVALPAEVLRSSRLEILGSGLGSVATADLLKCVRGVLDAAVPAGLEVDAMAVPLSDVAKAWNGEGAGRVVFTM